ncbi:MAG: hypothetical protein ABI406_07010 [Ktedonobacteraceae bacterium]
MTPEETIAYQEVWQTLEHYGLLLEADSQFPSLASIVAGEPVRGSWWGHAHGHAIYHVAEELYEHPDVIAIKLIAGKITYIYRKLWFALLSIGISHEPWQLDNLTDTAHTLLARVTKEHVLRTDHLRNIESFKAKSLSEAIRSLEKRLLVYTESIHTETGAHAKILETWTEWANRVGFTEKLVKPEQGKQVFEDILTGLNSQFATHARLPWT